MYGTVRSHFRQPPQPRDESTPQTQRKQSSRIPTKPSSINNSEPKQSKAAQHVSRFTKRASRTITPSADKTDHGTKPTAKVPSSVTTAHSAPAGSKRTSSVPPPPEVAPAGTSIQPNSRHNNVLLPPPTMRTPSLVYSESSASTFDSPRSNGLRRKPSTIEQYAAAKRSETPNIDERGTRMHRRNDELDKAFEDSVLGISMPPTSNYEQSGAIASSNPNLRLAKDTYPADLTVMRDITPPVPNYAQSATPSTRYTDSPFSHVPTPSSASSYSPAVVVTTTGATSRARQQSPTRSRPPVTSRSSDKGDPSRLGLPPVRESSTSSSNSTVKPGLRSTTSKRELAQRPATAPNKTSDSPRPNSKGKLVKERPKPTTNASTSKQPVQIPPELAHLNVDPPPKLSLNKALPPIRPSRDGTPTLSGVAAPSPVVQSDLPRLYTTYHKRTPSQETPSTTSPSLKTRFGLSPKTSSKHSSPRIDSAISPPQSARAFTRGPTPDAVPAEGQRLMRKDSPAVGPGPSPSKSSRFGLFSRKPKVDSSKTTEKPKRQPSKGPAAGTGHEGYGRFGIRGRSGSNSSSNDFRSTSVDSNASSQAKRLSGGRKSSLASKDGSELDDFLRERLNPITLRGSGSTVSNTASSSEAQLPSAPASSNHSSMDSYPKPQLLPSAMESTAGMSPAKQGSRIPRAPSDSSEDDVTARYPTLAARRSLTRLSQGDGKPAVRLPAPISTGARSKNSSIDSYGVENSAWSQTDSSLPVEQPLDGREGRWLRSPLNEPEVKAPKKRNFFQRAHTSPKSKGKGKAPVLSESPHTVVHQSPYGGVAHYAMLDPVDPVDLEEVERIMQEMETSPDDSTSENNMPPRVVRYEGRHTSLLPAPPKVEYGQDSDFKMRPNPPTILVRQDSSNSAEVLRAESTVAHQPPHVVNIQRSPVIPEPEGDQDLYPDPKVQMSQFRHNVHTPDMMQAQFNTLENLEDVSPARQPRLSPVGRIPKVISKRDRDRKLSDSSFSRPFARNQPRPTVKPPGSLYTQIRELASPVESGSQPVSSTSTASNGGAGDRKSSVITNPPSVSTNRTSMDLHQNSEFFSFPARKDSDVSYTSSSGNQSIWMTMAAQPPQEDDIWNEYNDFLDEVMPDRTRISTTSSLGAPFQYSGPMYDPNGNLVFPSMNWPQPPPTQLPQPSRSETAPDSLSIPQQIARFMQPSMSPLPTPTTDFLNHYGNRSTSTLITQDRTSIPGPKRASQASRSSIPGPNRSSLPRTSRSSLNSARGSTTSSRNSRGSAHSRSASLPEANIRNSQSSLTPSARFNRDTQLLDIAEVDGDEAAAAANLRFGALMTSKWLSFGRVLFSPAHNEMRLADEPRVLIVDGLGSDWSYYVALSYPAATVYNLGPASPNGFNTWPGVTEKAPSNHRHINHAAISAAFPFPKGFFTAVVFRFPLAATDQAYQACIFECKRVLRPGGHLEVAVLDLDLMNMGNKARKAVRGLKTRMQSHDQNVSLRNLSDVLVRLIGRRGFEEVQRCIVGVPAAGRIPRSQDLSSSSSGASGKPVWQREEQNGQEFSFADLLEDARASQIEPNKNNDEAITKMVAKVGRWWYSSCYEKTLLQTDNSIWHEPGLLRECEKQGTSFRLLICYAQKPPQTRRRTVSV